MPVVDDIFNYHTVMVVRILVHDHVGKAVHILSYPRVLAYLVVLDAFFLGVGLGFLF